MYLFPDTCYIRDWVMGKIKETWPQTYWSNTCTCIRMIFSVLIILAWNTRDVHKTRHFCLVHWMFLINPILQNFVSNSWSFKLQIALVHCYAGCFLPHTACYNNLKFGGYVQIVHKRPIQHLTVVITLACWSGHSEKCIVFPWFITSFQVVLYLQNALITIVMYQTSVGDCKKT